MSKSKAETHEGHAIGLLDDPKKIRKTIMRAVTDAGSAVDRENLSPGVDNLLVLHEALSGATREETLDRFDGNGYGTLKKDLAELVLDRIAPIQTRFKEIHGETGYLEKVLADGAEKAAEVADATLNQAMELVGLR
jgi:tryptophanyl-tRNA synthetase